MSAELQAGKSRKNKSATVAKMMSYLSMLWAMPEITMITVGAILCLNTDPDEKYKKDVYSWANIHTDFTCISQYEPIIGTTGITNFFPTIIKNPNRLVYQKEANKWLVNIMTERGIKVSTYITEDGTFLRQKLFEDFKEINQTNIKIQIDTPDSFSKTYPIAKCLHINSINLISSKEENMVMCKECATHKPINTGRQYRVVHGELCYSNSDDNNKSDVIQKIGNFFGNFINNNFGISKLVSTEMNHLGQIGEVLTKPTKCTGLLPDIIH